MIHFATEASTNITFYEKSLGRPYTTLIVKAGIGLLAQTACKK